MNDHSPWRDLVQKREEAELLKPTEIKIENLTDAEQWINVLHRRSCRDADVHLDLHLRLAWLELPWWRRLFTRRPQ